MSLTSREIALKALITFSKTGRWPEDTFRCLLQDAADDRERGLAWQIGYGVLQNRAMCDWWIGRFASMPMEKMQPAVREILRLSVYQIVYLDKIPDHAAVDEGVSLTKRYAGKKAAPFVNAVLRRVTEHKKETPELSGSPAEKLAVQYSHPLWIAELVMGRLGYDGCAAFLNADNQIPPVYAQVNKLKSDREEVAALFQSSEIAAVENPDLPDCFEITSGAAGIERWPSFSEGKFYVQDISAHLAAVAAAVCPGDFVIDGCAAPGGKSFASSIRMENRGRIISCDVQEKKLRKIEEGAGRLGISILETRLQDGRVFVPELENAADVVLADVPCSGLGVIRKKPDIRYKTKEEILDLPKIQLDILQNLSRYVKPGGVLLYSTCTVVEAENEGIVRAFLSANPDYEPEAFELPERYGGKNKRYGNAVAAYSRHRWILYL